MPELDPNDPVLTLWKTDDKEWMKQRRVEWKIIEESSLQELSKRDIADYKRFFLKGQKKGYLGSWSLFLFTPFTDANEAKLAFFSSFYGVHEREQILSSFLFSGMSWGADMPWIRRSMKAFSEGVLGKEYKEPHCIDFNGRKIRTGPPDGFCMSVVGAARRVLSGKDSYHGVLECFDYFFSALERCSKPDFLSRTRIPELIKDSERYLTIKDSGEDALKFAQNVVEHKDDMMAIYETWPKSE